MLNRVPSGGKLKVEHVVGVLEKRYPYVEISSILGPDSVYDNNRKVRDLFFLMCVFWIFEQYSPFEMSYSCQKRQNIVDEVIFWSTVEIKDVTVSQRWFLF